MLNHLSGPEEQQGQITTELRTTGRIPSIAGAGCLSLLIVAVSQRFEFLCK